MNASVLDIPRIYTGIAEWMACMLLVSRLPPRFDKKRTALLALARLVAQCLFLMLTDNVPLYFWVPCMIGAFTLMMGQILLLSQVGAATACYAAVHAFVLAEFAAALQWQLHYYLWMETEPVWWQKYALLIGVYGAVYLLAGLILSRLTQSNERLKVTKGELFITVIIGIMVFAISNLSFYSHNNPFASVYAREIMNVRTLVDFAGNVVLLTYVLQRKQLHYQKELDAMQTILENQYAQYRMSRDSIDMIDRKYHDLKHQIAALRTESDPMIREQWLQEMEEDICAYEAQNRTGNSVLDTVLTGKSLYCQKHGIEMLVVADGKPLSFMNTMDICTVFGNALDNAIECELKIPDKSKRVIRVMLNTQKQFLVMKVENYCPFPMKFHNGLPTTTKRDAANHGFGLKSIRHTAEKYGGSMTAGLEDEWFVLKMLIPLDRQK